MKLATKKTTKSTKKNKQKNKAKNKGKGKQMNGDHAMDVDDENENEEKNDVSMNGHAKENEVKLTKEQIQLIQTAINSATNDEEFDRLEKILRSGRMPEGDWKKMNAQSKT